MNHLVTLRFEHNRFSGDVTVLKLQNLQEFNISGNEFSGEIPFVQSSFLVFAFSKNKNLCGFPVGKCTKPGLASPVDKPDSPANTVISSSPTSLPSTTSFRHEKSGGDHHGSGGKISTVAIVAIRRRLKMM
ncbi:putative leucine-rich repeat domain superfamily [Helianthus anomalus]